jgi:dTDP-4-amino-4,6-dideoxygalactose transaminase
MEPIHLFSPMFRVDEALAEIRDCLEKGWTGLGYKTLEFEEAWKRHTGFPNAHFLNSATAGLHLALKLLKEDAGWADGDEIITTPLTFVSTNHVILYENLRPVFADVDESLCLDPQSVADRITSRTRAVCFVGLGGNIGRYHEVLDICRSRGIAFILDAAHMAGTWIGQAHAGTDADVTVFSFHAVKNLPTADAGMICFRRPDLDQEVRKWAWLGIDKDTYGRTLGDAGPYRWRYSVDHVGFKYHGNSVMAAIALVSLRYLERDNTMRRELAEWYDAEFKGDSRITLVHQPDHFLSSRHLYQVLVDDRDEVMVKMNGLGIFPGVHYADNTSFPMFEYGAGCCPRAHSAAARIISLPMHLRLTRADVGRVAKALVDSLT